MRYPTLSLLVLVLATACSREQQTQPAPAPAGFLNKVWTNAEFRGDESDLYVFLSDGTFIRASKGGGPDFGRWGWDGKQLSVIWSELPYTADIDSLTDSYFKLTFHLRNRSFEVGLVPATASLPDTTHVAEFDPTLASIHASGSNPTWLFIVENDHATLRMMRTTLRYEGSWGQEEPGAWEWDGKRQTENGVERISLDLREEACAQEPGIELPFSAVLLRGETGWRGCAVSGKLPSVAKPDTTK